MYFEHQPIGGLSGRVGVNGIMQRNFHDGASSPIQKNGTETPGSTDFDATFPVRVQQ